MDIHEAIRTIEKESEYDENEDDYARWRRRFMDIALFDDGDQYRSSKPLDVNEQGLIMLPTPGVHSLVAIVPNGFLNILLGAENTRMNEYEVGIIETDSKPATDITLDACFDEFSRKEQLGEEDAWYCPTCKKHQQATKKLDLWRLPEILVVHLKRFSHSRWHRDKIENMVNYPLQNLDLRTRIRSSANEQAVYDLFAVSVHYGGLGGGHYTAYAKNMTNRRWYDFDDSRVTEMNETEVLTKNAYILFYRRKREGDSDDGHLPGDEDTASLVNDEQHEASGNAPALAKEDDMSSDDNSITVHTERDADIARFFSPNEISDDDLPPVYSP
jgi:hypothetical protein